MSTLTSVMATAHAELTCMAKLVDEALETPGSSAARSGRELPAFGDFNRAFIAHCAAEDKVLSPAYKSLDDATIAPRAAAADASLGKLLAAAGAADAEAFKAAWRDFSSAMRQHLKAECFTWLPLLESSPNAADILARFIAALADSEPAECCAPADRAPGCASAHGKAPPAAAHDNAEMPATAPHGGHRDEAI